MPKLTPAIFQPVCNRSKDAAAFTLPSDGFIQIVPAGYAIGSGANNKPVRQLVDERAMDAILNALPQTEMLMDREHESHDPAKRTDALAWADLSTAEKRPDGIYAKPRLTNSGDREVLGGTLRFVSPEFPQDTLEEIEAGLFRPTQLVGLSFTNRPGFRNAKPVTNRETEPDPKTPTMKKELCLLLKLDEATTDALVLNRISELMTKAASADTLKTELETINNRFADDTITANEAAIPKDETLRKTLKSLLVTNRDGGLAMIKGFTEGHHTATETAEQKAAREARAERKPVFNREGSATPVLDDKKQHARAATVKNRATAMCDAAKAAGKPITFAQAFASADAEVAAV